MYCKDCFYFKKPLIIVVLVLFTLVFSGCSQQGNISPAPAAVEPEKIRIALAGDFLMHMPVVNSVKDIKTGKYNFGDIFTEISPALSGPDFTIANLETRLAGPEKGYCGYPLFNTPDGLAESMRELGIDMVTTANNHSMDMGGKGVVKTLDTLDRAGLLHVGTHRSPSERDTLSIHEIEGIRVGIINYTQSTNGLPVPSDAGYLVNLIRRDRMRGEIQKLRESGCDFIIAVIHFGTEYQRQPNEFQKTLARELIQCGADVVTGSHPHVVQPMEWLTVNRDGKEKKGLAAYSLGNFISNQRWRYSDCGIILNLEIVKTPGGPAELGEVGYTPVWVQRMVKEGRYSYRVLPVDQAVKNYETGADTLLTEEDYQRLKQVWQDTTELIGPEFRAGS
ncbi:MAG: CapA family protein [Bacillota bacterium]